MSLSYEILRVKDTSIESWSGRLIAFSIAFIDALFLCYSALTVTGLSTVNLSTCTVFQQVILYVLMGLGDVVRLLMIVLSSYANYPYARALSHGSWFLFGNITLCNTWKA